MGGRILVDGRPYALDELSCQESVSRAVPSKANAVPDPSGPAIQPRVFLQGVRIRGIFQEVGSGANWLGETWVNSVPNSYLFPLCSGR